MNFGLTINCVSIPSSISSVAPPTLFEVPIFVQRLTLCTSLEMIPLMEIPGIKRVRTSPLAVFQQVFIRTRILGPRAAISPSRFSNAAKFGQS